MGEENDKRRPIALAPAPDGLVDLASDRHLPALSDTPHRVF
jgi:hypothetical protein